MLTLENYYPYLFQNLKYTPGGIPKIIHQTWKNNDVPKHWKKSPEMWKKYHPDYKYVLWTDEDNREHIKLFHQEFLELYDNYPYAIQRADMIRYFLLYDFGGIYSDLDVYPSQSIDKWILNDSLYLIYSGNFITNFFMISKRNHPFWIDVQNELKSIQLPFWVIFKHFTVLMSTGPVLIDRCYHNSKYNITLLPRHYFSPYNPTEDKKLPGFDEAVLIPLEGKSWNSYDSMFFNFCYKHREIFIFLIIMSIIFVIIGCFYYFKKFNTCKIRLNKSLRL